MRLNKEKPSKNVEADPSYYKADREPVKEDKRYKQDPEVVRELIIKEMKQRYKK